jgi:hypothetical protein
VPNTIQRIRPIPPLSERDERRFWSKVALPNEQGCMLWLDRPDGNGCGNFHLQGQTFRSHQISYWLAYGPAPAGKVIDHVKAKGCTNRHCVAPEHLEAITQAENVRRAMKTHCKRGHLLSGANVYTRLDNGIRQCRACAKLRRKAARIPF